MSFFSRIKSKLSNKTPNNIYEKKFVIEWCVTASITLALLAISIHLDTVKSVGNIFYDEIEVNQPSNPSKDIILVAIDDKSISALGGWPLSRKFYASFLQKLADENNKPTAVGFDILFLDPTLSDQVLSDQIKRQRVVLPVEFRYDEISDKKIPIFPISPIKEATSNYGHIEINYDGDGVIRGSKLLSNHFENFALKIYNKKLKYQNVYTRFPMIDPAIGYNTVSLSDALSDHFDRSIFKNKYVLLGATAASLGDRYPTVFSGKHDAGTPGVQIHADLLTALLEHKLIKEASPESTFIYSCISLSLILICLLTLSPAGEILVTFITLISLITISYLLLSIFYFWINPLPAIITIVLVKPIWAWRRMELISHFMHEKTSLLKINDHALIPSNISAKNSFIQCTQLLNDAIESASERLNFLALVIREIPEAVFISNEFGVLIQYNQKMGLIFDLKEGMNVTEFFQKLNAFNEIKIDALLKQNDSEERFAAYDKNNQLREFRMKILPLPISKNIQWQLTMMVDITDVIQLQKQRDRTLAILSHDMRTPLASILAILRSAYSVEIKSEKIANQANHLLNMMDDFILSIRAELEHYKLEETLIENVIDESIFQVQDLMTHRSMSIHFENSQHPIFVKVDARLMVRVIVNILGNAIRYGKKGSVIQIGIANNATGQDLNLVELTITNLVGDVDITHSENKGFGMGLEFVETVLKKHHGKLHRFIPTNHDETATVKIYLPSY